MEKLFENDPTFGSKTFRILLFSETIFKLSSISLVERSIETLSCCLLDNLEDDHVLEKSVNRG